MKFEIVLPQMGESISEGILLHWFKKPGDRVEKDEVLYEISTDKVDSEIPSPISGVITEIKVQEGESALIDSVLAYVETEEKIDLFHSGLKESPEQDQEPQIVPKQRVKAPMPPLIQPDPVEPLHHDDELMEVWQDSISVKKDDQNRKKRFYSPLVLRIAHEEEIPLSALETLKGSGIGGRITKRDILQNISKLKRQSAATSPLIQPGVQVIPPDAHITTPSQQIVTRDAASIREKPKVEFGVDGTSVVPMDSMRAIIAEHMLKSVQTSPHVTAVSEADVTSLVQYRDQENPSFKSREGFSLNYTAFIARALVLAIGDFPEINASVDGTNIIYKRHINIGIAVALEYGLIVPAVKHAEEKTLVGLARSVYDVSSRARNKKLMPDEIVDSTITITNFGSFGNVIGTPIINQPNVAILGVGAIKKRPEVIGGAIAIRDMVYLSLSFDHRIVDGASGGMFVSKIAEYLENFEELL